MDKSRNRQIIMSFYRMVILFYNVEYFILSQSNSRNQSNI